MLLDGLGRKTAAALAVDFPLSRYILKYKNNSILFSPKGITGTFFTEDSKRYLTQAELRMQRRRERIVRIVRRLDSLNAHSFEKTKLCGADSQPVFSLNLKRHYGHFRDSALALANGSREKLTLVRVWNLSIVGAVIFGMFMMTMIYRYLGQSVSAQIQSGQTASQQQLAAETDGKVMGVSDQKDEDLQIDAKYFTQLLGPEEMSQAQLEKEIRTMVKGYPIEKMAPLIAQQDRTVAAFLVGIARQESSWGVHVPTYQGQDCYNYWGYRGKNPIGTGGHTCFASPEDAVNTVAKRLEFLVKSQQRNTPEKMILWKCGDCSWDNQRDMQRWISSVSTYFHKLNTD